MNAMAKPSVQEFDNAPRYWLQPRAQAAYLFREWRLMFRAESMPADALAGLAVALVALPLSLAIANASGVRPEVGLISAIVGGIVVALFGGCRLQVSGPAAAMTFLVFEVVTKYGHHGLIVATMMAALLQLLAGALRMGRFMELIPRPVIAGFLSGIGLTILCTQLPVVLGYDVTHDDEGGALGFLGKTLKNVSQTEPTSLAVGVAAIATMLLLPRISRKLPGPLFAVFIASVLPFALGWKQVALLGALPTRFPAPSLPNVPWELWNELVMAALAIFMLASLESLLSASVVDSLAKGPRADNNQELIGQGLGNLASALLGGIPVTGVIARSATNIQARAQSRLSAVLHALTLLAMLVYLAPWVGRIPRAALAGVLIAVALRMVEVHRLRTLWRGSRAEALVFVTTTGTILVTDLIVGIPVGMIGAFMYVVYEMSRLNLNPHPLAEADTGAEPGAAESCPSVLLMEVEGPLFFASGYHLRNMVNRMGSHRCLVLDLQHVPFLDVTGAELLGETIESLKRRGMSVVLARPSATVARRLRHLTRRELPALRDCPVYRTIRDAMLHAATELGPGDLCAGCRPEGRCAGLERAMKEIGSLDRTAVPRVRAVIARVEGGNAWDVDDASRAPGRPLPRNRRKGRLVVHPSAIIDRQASVSGDLTVRENVFIGPGVSIRAGEGTPFHIGPESILQDGVTLHAPRGRVILVQGLPYAIYIGRDVGLACGALVHGPCFLGDRSFVGFRATVHDAVIGDGCVIGIGAVVAGVSLPPGRYVGHQALVDTQEKADALPDVDPTWQRFRAELLETYGETANGARDGQPVPLEPITTSRREDAAS